MIYLHFIGLLTFEILVLISAFAFKVYVEKNELGKNYRHFSKTVLIILHVLIVLTIVHVVIFHFSHGCGIGNDHMEMMKNHGLMQH